MGFSIGNAVGAVVGSVADRLLSKSDQKKQMEMQNTYNLQNFNMSKDWEKEKMLNAHQWEMEDLRKAGINPGLTAGDSGAVGSGAPGTTTPTSGTGFGNFGQNFINGLNTLESIEYQKKLADSQSYKNVMSGNKDAMESKLLPKQVQNQTRDSITNQARQKADELNQQYQNRLLEQQTIYQSLDNMIKSVEAEINAGNFGKAMGYIDRTLNTMKNAGGVAQSIMQAILLWKGAGDLKSLAGMVSNFKKSNAFKLMNKTYKSKK